MDLESLERVRISFDSFHAFFADLFGRKEVRANSRRYLRGLLVQVEERSNAENVAEAVGAKPRDLQRFLTDARWEDLPVIARLQRYLGPRLEHEEAVWAIDETGFAKQGKKSVGVKRQYSGTLGKTGNCQIGVFLAHVGPRGRALVDRRLYLPREWVEDVARCEEALVPEDARRYYTKAELALLMLQRAKEWGYLRADWVTADEVYGNAPDFRDGVAALGLHYVVEVAANTPVWPVEWAWEVPPYRGRGPRPVPRPLVKERQEARQRAAALPEDAWQAVTVAEGSQGPRTYLFARERVRESRDGKPGALVWLLHRRNLDGSEPRYYFSNAPADTSVATLARVCAQRWPIETEFQETKDAVGLDEYEVRSWPGWYRHITMSLLANAFLLTLQQEWGEKGAPSHPTPGVSSCARTAAAEALDLRRPAVLDGGDATAQ
jgi:SRSO17 transposase